MNHSRIKSFVLRAGRMSPRQQLALQAWLPAYEWQPLLQPLSLPALFGNDHEVVLEIGFGMGGSLVAMAQARPELNFLGVEVHRAGIGSLVADLHDAKITNVKIVTSDAVALLEHSLADGVLAGAQIFFPDPWPKKRHHKRRLIQAAFVHTLASRIKCGGFVHCATDWQDYALHMLAVLNQEPLLCNQQVDGSFAPRPVSRPITKFETRGHRLGHGVWDLMFTRAEGC